MSDSHHQTYDHAADAVVELGNQMVHGDDSVDVWDVATGMLAGAVQYGCLPGSPVRIHPAKPVRKSSLRRAGCGFYWLR